MNSPEFEKLLLNDFKFNATKDQKLAIHHISCFLCDKFNSNLFLLKGYAGTGKTTLISSIVNIFETDDRISSIVKLSIVLSSSEIPIYIKPLPPRVLTNATRSSNCLREYLFKPGIINAFAIPPSFMGLVSTCADEVFAISVRLINSSPNLKSGLSVPYLSMTSS